MIQTLRLDDHFIKHLAATFFVTAEGGGMAEHGILTCDTMIVDGSPTPGTGSIVIAAIEGELNARPFAARGHPLRAQRVANAMARTARDQL